MAALPAGLLGLTYWARGELDAALTTLRAGMEGFRALGDAAAALSFTFAIADVLTAQGRLGEARRTFEDALREAEDVGDATLPGVAELHVGLAEVLIAIGDPDAAGAHVRAAEELGDAAVLPGDAGRLASAYARVALALGDADAAHARLDEAERLQVAGPVPDVRPLDAIRTRVWLAQGRWAEARAWADGRDAPEAPPDYVDEYAWLTVARVGLAAFRLEGNERALARTDALLQRVVEAAEAHGRAGTLVEALVLQALVAQADGDLEAATLRLTAALRRRGARGGARGLRRRGSGDGAAPARGAPRRRPARLRAPAPGRPARGGRASPGAPRVRRTAQRSRARRAALAAEHPDGSPGRPRAGHVGPHAALPHEEHLREARRPRPPRGGRQGGRARPDLSLATLGDAGSPRPSLGSAMSNAPPTVGARTDPRRPPMTYALKSLSVTANARMAGVWYLILAICGGFAEFGVRQRLIVPGDAATTAQNLLANDNLFRFGIVTELIGQVVFVLLVFALYDLLKVVHRRQAQVMVALVLLAVGTTALNLVNQGAALVVLDGGAWTAAFEPAQREALATPLPRPPPASATESWRRSSSGCGCCRSARSSCAPASSPSSSAGSWCWRASATWSTWSSRRWVRAAASS